MDEKAKTVKIDSFYTYLVGFANYIQLINSKLYLETSTFLLVRPSC